MSELGNAIIEQIIERRAVQFFATSVPGRVMILVSDLRTSEIAVRPIGLGEAQESERDEFARLVREAGKELDQVTNPTTDSAKPDKPAAPQ